MDIALLVTAPPTGNGQAALDFAHAAQRAGHRVSQVFFYRDAVLTAAAGTSDNRPASALGQAWVAFAGHAGTDTNSGPNRMTELVVCVGAASRRGLATGAVPGAAGQPIAAGFVVSGLGQLAASTATADRVVTFA